MALIAQAVIAAVAGYFVFMQTFRVAGCSPACGYDAVATATQIQLWVTVGVILASIGAVAVLSRRGKESWWAPAAGIVLILATAATSTIAIIAATTSWPPAAP